MGVMRSVAGGAAKGGAGCFEIVTELVERQEGHSLVVIIHDVSLQVEA